MGIMITASHNPYYDNGLKLFGPDGMKLSDQKKGTLLAFTAIMFITPDSLLIRLSNVESWNLIFYRGLIPFIIVFIGLLIVQKNKVFHSIIENGWHGAAS